MKKQKMLYFLLVAIFLISSCSAELVKVKGLKSGRIEGQLNQSDYEYSLQLLKQSKEAYLKYDYKLAIKYVNQSISINKSKDSYYQRGIIFSAQAGIENKKKAIDLRDTCRAWL